MESSMGRSPPGPTGLPLLGVVPSMIRHGADYLQQAFERHGDVVRLPLLGPLRMVLVAHPDHIGHVLQANHKNYVVKRPSLHLTAMMGSGLTSATARCAGSPICRSAPARDSASASAWRC